MFLYEPHEPETLNQVQSRPVQLQWNNGVPPSLPHPPMSPRAAAQQQSSIFAAEGPWISNQ